MKGAVALVAALGDEDDGSVERTRDVSLYRLLPGRDLEDYWRVDDEDAAVDYASIPVEGVGDAALLVFGERPWHPREWVRYVEALTGHDLGYRSADASALVLIRSGEEVFGLAFGSGRRLLHGRLVDRDFGLEFALRVLDADAVRRVKRQFLNARGRTDINAVPSGQELWSYGIREHAELVRQLTGSVLSAARIDLSHSHRARRRTSAVRIDCADRVRLPLSESPIHLVADLREINRVMRDREIDAELAPLRWVRRLPADRADVAAEAWDVALEMLDQYDEAVSISYPSSFHGGPEVNRWQGQIGRVRIDTPELVLPDISEALRDTDRARWLRVLETSRIGGLDDSGDAVATEEPGVSWLTAEVELPDGERLVLLDGDWYDVSDGYVEHVERVVAAAFADHPSWTLPSWSSAPVSPQGRREERYYNEYVGRVPGFLCLDRKLVRTRAHRRGFEACDLLGPGDELVHVKKISSRTGSGPLSHLFAQGIVAVESLTDPETWHRFVQLVGEHDPERADRLGNRPHTLVYAVHRANGLLTADRLFTFARSELASAVQLFQKLGVRLQISVIP